MTRGWNVAVVCLGLLMELGCSASTPVPATEEDRPVREQFTALQAAIQADDPDKLWSLLDSTSQADAERVARDIHTAHDGEKPENQQAQETMLGLSADEVKGMTGKTYLKSKPFRKRYHELPESTIQSVEVKKDHATLYFLEPDGDREKAIFIRENGQWKAWLKMPKPEK